MCVGVETSPAEQRIDINEFRKHGRRGDDGEEVPIISRQPKNLVQRRYSNVQLPDSHDERPIGPGPGSDPGCVMKISAWNTGGFKCNSDSIFEIMRQSALYLLVETFISEDQDENIRFPGQFIHFSSPALYNENIRYRGGRSSGGLLLMLDKAFFNGRLCKIVFKSQSILGVCVVPHSGV